MFRTQEIGILKELAAFGHFVLSHSKSEATLTHCLKTALLPSQSLKPVPVSLSFSINKHFKTNKNFQRNELIQEITLSIENCISCKLNFLLLFLILNKFSNISHLIYVYNV